MPTSIMADEERCYRAVLARDARFDGWFVLGVTSTGIYCRPSCPARTPQRRNVRFFATTAAAQGAGFRACKRCRPDASPGSPEWRARSDVAARAMRLIAEGEVDRVGVAGLAGRLGYSMRHLSRVLNEELGAGPLALARAQRTHTARILMETTSLPFSEVAFASGFASIRQFNDTVREVFALTPTQLRHHSRHRHAEPESAGVPPPILLRLPAREPFAGAELFSFLAARAVPGLEMVTDSADGTPAYARALRLPLGQGVVSLTPMSDHVAAHVTLSHLRDLPTAVERCRRMLDLDADAPAIDAHLGGDRLLRPLVTARPGLRVPGSPDPAELAVRAILGQQVSVAGARTLTARLVARYGDPLDAALRGAAPGVSHTFPSPASLTHLDLSSAGGPRARTRCLMSLAAALTGGDVLLDPATTTAEAEDHLGRIPGIGPWTIGYIRMRGLGDPDVMLPTDLGVQRSLTALGGPTSPRAIGDLADAWSPWRSYALLHLWTAEHRSPPRRSQ